jgi:hypothetical protein
MKELLRLDRAVEEIQLKMGRVNQKSMILIRKELFLNNMERRQGVFILQSI